MKGEYDAYSEYDGYDDYDECTDGGPTQISRECNVATPVHSPDTILQPAFDARNL
jgi:hypothetical protein